MEATNFTLRLDSDVKKECEAIFSALGMNLTTAINIFLRKSISVGGIPFNVRLDEKPNRETIKALEEGDRIVNDPNVKAYTNMKDLIEALEA